MNDLRGALGDGKETKSTAQRRKERKRRIEIVWKRLIYASCPRVCLVIRWGVQQGGSGKKDPHIQVKIRHTKQCCVACFFGCAAHKFKAPNNGIIAVCRDSPNQGFQNKYFERRAGWSLNLECWLLVALFSLPQCLTHKNNSLEYGILITNYI